jgi:hypothetical protein
MKPTEYSILPQSNTRARVPIASWLWLGILHCLALTIWHQSTEPKALSNSLSGPAWVRDIEPCQGVLPGDGQVITATFQHSSGDVIDQVWSDDGSRNLESIGTTSNHPFYSIDRGDYVQAGSLQEGERLLTYSGDTKRVVSKLARPGPETVYNLEVFGEHVYFIGHDGVLVHNSDSYGLNAGATSSAATRTPVKLAEAGEDLFVGDYGQVRRANIKSGINSTHTPHHSVQDAVSSTSHWTGVSINMRKDLHALTRTYSKPVEEGLSLRQHLYKDVWDVKNILTNAGYDRSVINAQLKELIRQNKAVGGFGK